MNSKPKVGILSPGDMGHSVGQVLRDHGIEIITCLQGRSLRTKNLAEQAGFRCVSSYAELTVACDILLSILVPAQAYACAKRVAAALQNNPAELLYVDCNAVSPQTVKRIAGLTQQAGAAFVDASIIGPPPREQGVTRFYASGVKAPVFAALSHFGLDIRVLGDEIGRGSAIKMCYASSTKGFAALCLELMTAAQALGVSEALLEEFQISQPALYERLQRSLPAVPAKARRFVGEMEEIAATYQALGLTPEIFQGAAAMYELLGGTALADRLPEDDNLPDFETVLDTMVQALPKTR